MRLPTFTASVITLAMCATASVIPERRDEPFAGYLMTGFFDNSHNIEQFLSVGNDPINFQQLNQGKSILNPDIGTGGIRDPYLTTNSDRSVFYLIATGMTLSQCPKSQH